MPIYEYECRSCGKRTELLQRMDDAPLAACPQCGGEVKKLVSAPAVQFKGSGWYVTDYAGKKGGSGASGGGPEAKSESTSEKAEKTEKTEKTEKKEAPAESKSSGSSSSGSGSSGGTES
ncbi:MAG TPA: FmdB family zinc ribbon protein [Thermoanaerobaculia bacterium]|nr:FmdB family zinc ribbon protein [Thermoanaerobaculia bacterium]